MTRFRMPFRRLKGPTNNNNNRPRLRWTPIICAVVAAIGTIGKATIDAQASEGKNQAIDPPERACLPIVKAEIFGMNK